MRAYDIDITLRIRCVAHNRDEAVDTVVDRFDSELLVEGGAK